MKNIGLILYINLDRREDRREQILSELDGVTKNFPSSPKIVRISACAYPQLPALGCTLSHIMALKYALSTDIDCQHILVLEDDFAFTRGIQETDVALQSFFDMASSVDNPIEWECILLSYGETHIKKYYNHLISRVVMSHHTSGYLIRKVAVPALVDLYTETLKPLMITRQENLYACDVVWSKLMANNKWFMFNHRLGIQRSGYSDIDHQAKDTLLKQCPFFIPRVCVIHDLSPSIIALREIMNRDSIIYTECQHISMLKEKLDFNVIITLTEKANKISLEPWKEDKLAKKCYMIDNPDIYPRLTFVELLGQNNIYSTTCYVRLGQDKVRSDTVNRLLAQIQVGEDYVNSYYKNLRLITGQNDINQQLWNDLPLSVYKSCIIEEKDIPKENIYKFDGRKMEKRYILEHVLIDFSNCCGDNE